MFTKIRATWRKPKIIKTLHHDVGFWKRVRQVHPSAFIIGRLFTPNQEFQSNPEARGREFAERILREEVNRATFEGRPLFNAWESFNEAIPENVAPDVIKAYDAFQVAFARRIYEAGFEPIGMNFGTGNFMGHHFLDNFRGTLETYRYLGFHEYDWPTMWRLHKESEAKDGGTQNIAWDNIQGAGDFVVLKPTGAQTSRVVQPVQAAQPAQSSQATCPTCRGQLSYIQQYQRWYCYKCQKYC